METRTYKGHTITRTGTTRSNAAGRVLGYVHTIEGPQCNRHAWAAPTSWSAAKAAITNAVEDANQAPPHPDFVEWARTHNGRIVAVGTVEG